MSPINSTYNCQYARDMMQTGLPQPHRHTGAVLQTPDTAYILFVAIGASLVISATLSQLMLHMPRAPN